MVRVREDRVAHDARMLSALQAKVGELESEITQMKEEKDVLSQGCQKNVETRLEIVQSDKNHVVNKLEFLQMSHTKDVERSEKMLGEMKSCHAEAIASKEEEFAVRKACAMLPLLTLIAFDSRSSRLKRNFQKRKRRLWMI
eukprot:jgi/Picre1/30106/NNA_005475.t1